ncbi:MAG: glycosyltransferase [Opitutaceae bacterium]
MKILFFCSSLEPGRDGVGDYTVRLAEECVTRGHRCTLIALNDGHVSRATDMTQENVRLIRLPATETWSERLAGAGRHLRDLAPDWVSWQLVAYGFNPRGFLPAQLLQAAPDLRGRRCHVMLHELWLGLERGSGVRARLTGWLQRRGVLRLLHHLHPDCVQTSQATYQAALQQVGFEAGVLDLFGNVPVAEKPPASNSPLSRWLPADSGSPPLVAVTFGTLHPQWQPMDTARWLVATAQRLARRPVLIVIGRAGTHAPGLLEPFRQQGVTVVVTGELDVTAVSQLLAAADLGIAVHPWALIGKSGAATAMLEHGLPVLVPRDDWRLRRGPELRAAPSDPLLVRLTGLDDAQADRWLASRRAPEARSGKIAASFLATLERASPDASTL